VVKEQMQKLEQRSLDDKRMIANLENYNARLKEDHAKQSAILVQV
jgi:hypothetical protein